ncbi:MAG: hypothetical protein CME38_01335 [Haliea sp.]|nr:hypothetical protein [Haliea sp.]|tara:strand:+ start:3124 stop:3420 length:297 start_codon:yes stop_codon:yes gene_type:complete
MNEKIQIRAVSAPWHSGVELLVRHGDSVGVSINMETLDHNRAVEPTVRIGRDEAQTLMDDLWTAGLRPTEGTGSAGSLQATEKHLSDMRKIAFKQLGM